MSSWSCCSPLMVVFGCQTGRQQRVASRSLPPWLSCRPVNVDDLSSLSPCKFSRLFGDGRRAPTAQHGGQCKGGCLGRIANYPSLFANRSLGDKNAEASCDPARRFLAPSGDLSIRLPGAL